MRKKCIAFLIWAVLYGAAVSSLAEGDVVSLIVVLLGFVAVCCGVGVDGLLVREVTISVIRAHPIQTILCVSILSCVLLPLFSMAVFWITQIPLYDEYTSCSGGIVFGVLLWMIVSAPQTAATSALSTLLCRLLHWNPIKPVGAVDLISRLSPVES